jgi:hypothetical protein
MQKNGMGFLVIHKVLLSQIKKIVAFLFILVGLKVDFSSIVKVHRTKMHSIAREHKHSGAPTLEGIPSQQERQQLYVMTQANMGNQE